tara:strand:- start:74 stop:700 length:627 start_codon:yes stop_codon:yes gene_type:complete
MTVKLIGSSSGSVALDAPASTTSGANIEFKLPVADGSAGQVLQTDGSGNLSWVSKPTGLTAAQQFRLTAPLNVPNSYTTLTSNWAKVSGSIGSFADPASGIFSFPLTGIYSVRFSGYFEDTGATPYGILRIFSTSDGSNYSPIATGINSNADIETYNYCGVTVEAFVDVTNTTNDKVYFAAYNDNTAALDGNASQNRTYVTFLRLGDT